MSLTSYVECNHQERLKYLSTVEFCVNILVHICLDLKEKNTQKATKILINLLDLLIESYAVLRIKKLHLCPEKDEFELSRVVCSLTDYIRSNFIELVLMNYARITGIIELRSVILNFNIF